jgi:RNA polymerase sigma factor (sigma-70 family)
MELVRVQSRNKVRSAPNAQCATAPDLEAEALREIELSLYGKLRAHRLSESFIGRCGPDALQQGFAEYVRAVERGTEIENRDAWVVSTAFRRAIDELRREVRRADGAVVEAVLASGGVAAPPAEEAALAHLEADQLREAIETLAPEQRQALSLYYFEERTGRESARALGCSERTFRRRLDSAVEQLRQRFGIAIPEPDSQLAITAGLAAWASLVGARVVPAQGPLEHLLAAADALRRTSAAIGGRARGLAARVTLGNGEGISAAATGPLGKATGACAGALAACALTGVIGPGVGGVDLLGGNHAKPPVRHGAFSATPRQLSPAPRSSQSSPPAEPTSNSASPNHHQPRTQHLASGLRHTRRATHEATSQFGVESAPSPGADATPPVEHSEATSSSPPLSSTSSSPTEVANEQFSP